MHTQSNDRQLADYEQWFLDHRQDDLVPIVLHLLRVGLRNGEYDADDARQVVCHGNPKVRGGAVKLPVRWGMAENSGLCKKSEAKEAKQRIIWRYRLTRPDLAQRVLDGVQRVVLGDSPVTEAGELKQQSFANV